MRHGMMVVAAVACLSIVTLGQTADELVNKNIQAKGGMDKIKAIHSIRITGKLNGGGGFTAAITPLSISAMTSSTAMTPSASK